MDYRDKSCEYDYILEEFHLEYKLDIKTIIELVQKHIEYLQSEDKQLLEDSHKQVLIDYYKKYPEKPIDDLVEECNSNIQLVQQYFEGYVNPLDLAKTTFAYLDEPSKASEELATKGCNVNAEAVVRNVLKTNPANVKRALYVYFCAHLTVIKNIYMVQSPKDKKTDLPTIHYSLKEKFLSDFRALRNIAKKNMAKAEDAGDKQGTIRFNSKQLAIKTLCNSEYGATGNASFAYYDPDIAAAVTHCARSLIGMLTDNLESPFVFVDKKFFDDHQKDIERLISCEALTVEEGEYSDEVLFKYRRHCIRSIFNDVYEVVADKIYKLILKPAKVVYQDTDSNYYINNYIQDYYMKNQTVISPEIINEMMYSMFHHNCLLSDFTTASIARRPVGLGFEGSFIVCRYLNRKKKYYGRQWSPDGVWFPGYKLEDSAYDNGILKKRYNKWFVKKKTVLPYEDGTYIELNNNQLLNTGVNYLDYVKSFGCKCTGVDLARRDQFKYINYHHVMVLQQDLRIMKYTGKDNVWELVPKTTAMQTVIDGLMNNFRKMFADAQKFASTVQSRTLDADKGDLTPFERYIKFSIKEFAKTAAYRPGKANTVTKIIELHNQANPKEFEKYMPKTNERINYVVISDSSSSKMFEKAEIVPLLVDKINMEVRMHVVNDMVANDVKLPEKRRNMKYTSLHDQLMHAPIDTAELYAYTTFENNYGIDYDEFWSAFMLSKLDHVYYIKQLYSALVLYTISDIYPEEVVALDYDETLTEAERNARVSKMKESATKAYLVRIGLKSASKTTVTKTVSKYDKLKDNATFIENAKIVYKIHNHLDANYNPNIRELASFINVLDENVLADIQNIYQVYIEQARDAREQFYPVKLLLRDLKVAKEKHKDCTFNEDYEDIAKILFAGYCKDNGITCNVSTKIPKDYIDDEFIEFIENMIEDDKIKNVEQDYKQLLKSSQIIVKALKSTL